MLKTPSPPQNARSGLRAGPSGLMQFVAAIVQPVSGVGGSDRVLHLTPCLPFPCIPLAAGANPAAHQDMLKRGSR
jgi:hypothetical protein